MKPNQKRSVTFRGQIAPGRKSIGADGGKDGGEVLFLVPETDIVALLDLVAHFRQKRLLITVEITE